MVAILIGDVDFQLAAPRHHDHCRLPDELIDRNAHLGSHHPIWRDIRVPKSASGVQARQNGFIGLVQFRQLSSPAAPYPD
jgi:hypothetical protein